MHSRLFLLMVEKESIPVGTQASFLHQLQHSEDSALPPLQLHCCRGMSCVSLLLTWIIIHCCCCWSWGLCMYLHLTLFLWFFSLHSQFVELVPTSYGNTYSKIFPADRWDVIWTSRHFWEDGPGREKNRPTVFVMPFLICTPVSMIQCLLPILAILHSTGSFFFAVIGTHVCFPEDNSLVGIQCCCYDDDLWTMWQSWPSASLELLMDQ